ncbi:hypothetical protein DMENIID0001_041280 [Sergentomyia squamirostris]
MFLHLARVTPCLWLMLINATTVAEITGLNEILISRFQIIIEAISCNHPVDTKKFDVYARETARLYIQLYSWLPMSPTTHKILMHGGMVIENFMLPIGQLSEEAAEARNKHYKEYKSRFARTCSRKSTIHDVFYRLLLTSDPYMSLSQLKHSKASSLELSKGTLDLLITDETDDDDASESFSSTRSPSPSWYTSPSSSQTSSPSSSQSSSPSTSPANGRRRSLSRSPLPANDRRRSPSRSPLPANDRQRSLSRSPSPAANDRRRSPSRSPLPANDRQLSPSRSPLPANDRQRSPSRSPSPANDRQRSPSRSPSPANDRRRSPSEASPLPPSRLPSAGLRLKWIMDERVVKKTTQGFSKSPFDLNHMLEEMGCITWCQHIINDEQFHACAEFLSRRYQSEDGPDSGQIQFLLGKILPAWVMNTFAYEHGMSLSEAVDYMRRMDKEETERLMDLDSD